MKDVLFRSKTSRLKIVWWRMQKNVKEAGNAQKTCIVVSLHGMFVRHNYLYLSRPNVFNISYIKYKGVSSCHYERAAWVQASIFYLGSES